MRSPLWQKGLCKGIGIRVLSGEPPHKMGRWSWVIQVGPCNCKGLIGEMQEGRSSEKEDWSLEGLEDGGAGAVAKAFRHL